MDIWFESRGVRLFAFEKGDGHSIGQPIVLLHGGLANHLACWLFAEPLASRFRVITPDLRGAGRSGYGGALAWDVLADDVAALVQHRGLSRVAIGGTSFGAAVAVRFALRHPALVSALLVLNPAYGGDELGLAPAQVAAMQAMDALGRRSPTEGIEVMFPLFDALPPEIRDRARRVVAAFDPEGVAATTAFMASLAQPFARAAELAAITAPALVVPGIDPTHPREVALVYRDHLPHGELCDADPAAYAAVIEAFLERVLPA